MKIQVAFAAGIAAGISIVIACGKAGTSVTASPNDCAAWEIATVKETDLPERPEDFTGRTGQSIPLGVLSIPAGWQPFSLAFAGEWEVRRCKP